MKTFLLTVICFTCYTSSFSQAEILLDSISGKNLPEQNIGIRCAGTFNNSRSPLYVVDGVPMLANDGILKNIDPELIVSINVLKNPPAIFCYGPAGRNGVILISTKVNPQTVIQEKELPFKVYSICNTNWNTSLDLYNAIQTKVPNVSITAGSYVNSKPNIRMRGDDNTIVIVDGVRYDASILNTINPADIENIKVANGAAATNYLINN